MQINRSDQEHYDARRQSLIQQILSYRKRIDQYQVLQKELKTISVVIDKQQFNTTDTSSTKTITKTVSRKSLDNSQKRLSDQFKKDPNQRRISSSKKIKLYQLQKKLARLSKDHNQKFSSFISSKRQHQVTLETINQLAQLIEKEKANILDLQKQDSQLVQELVSKNTEYLRVKKDLEQVCEKKESYFFEKQSFLDKINTQNKNAGHLKNLISFTQSQIFPFTQKQPLQSNNFLQSYQLSNTLNKKLSRFKQTYRQDHEMVPNQDLSYSQIEGSSYCNKNNKKEEIRSFEVDGVMYSIIDSNHSFESLQMSPSENCFQSHHFRQNPKSDHTNPINQPNQARPTAQLNLMNKKSKQKQISPKTSSQSNIFSVLKDKVQIVQSMNCELNEDILKVKKETISIETEMKHHKTSLELLKQKIKMKNMFIQRQKITHLKNLSSIEQIRRQLSQKQGERGQMRGRIGTRVDQQGILKLINTTLQKDLQNLKEKTDCLIVYRNMLCGQIIQLK